MRYELTFVNTNGAQCSVACRNYDEAINALSALRLVGITDYDVRPKAWWGKVFWAGENESREHWRASSALNAYASARLSAARYGVGRLFADATKQKEALREARAKLAAIKRDPLQHTYLLLLNAANE